MSMWSLKVVRDSSRPDSQETQLLRSSSPTSSGLLSNLTRRITLWVPGGEAQEKKSVLNLTHPVKRALIDNWDDMEKVKRRPCLINNRFTANINCKLQFLQLLCDHGVEYQGVR